MLLERFDEALIDEKTIMVSVIIPTHKGSRFIDRAIKSVLGQSYSNIEIIIVDDNGEGTEEQVKTEEVVKNFLLNGNVKYLTYMNNMNASHARNVGIKNAGGEYIALLDDDDEMLPDKIKKQVYCMENKDTSYAACYTDYKIHRGAYIEVSKEYLEGQPYFEALSRNLYICGGSNLLIRKSVLEEIGGFDESFKRNQDIELLTRIIYKYKIAHVDGYQLIVHMEERKKERKHNGYDRDLEIDKFYLDKFKDKIQALNLDDQRLLYLFFALERFKRSIGTKNIINAILNLKKQQVSVLLFFRYVIYLVKRKYKKEIYGFRMK